MVDPNTRQGKRTPVTLKIKFKSETLEQFIERYAVDVSQGGIFIRTKEPLAVGTQMRFEFQLRDASPLIAGEGTVVWTRENDPSRPAIAPGMGVRFDRLAEGSQTVLEKILSEKAKQAPQRPAENSKPPMFTDTPTKVAPAPVQEALLTSGERSGSTTNPPMRPSGNFDGGTPLPKPVPFHSDAEDFDDQAFDEATKVRAVDDLVAQSALPDAESRARPVTPAAQNKPVTTPTSQPVAAAPVPAPAPEPSAPAITSEPAASAPTSSAADDAEGFDRDSAPVLPSPPAKSPRPVEATPSPRSGSPSTPPANAAQTKLGVEPAAPAATARAAAATTTATRTPAPNRPAVAADRDDDDEPAYPTKRSSAAPTVILVLVVLAAAAAGVWFFVLRDKAKTDATTTPGSGSAILATGSGSAATTGSAGAVVPTPGSGSALDVGSATPDAGSGSQMAAGSGSAAVEPVAGPTVDTVIAATPDKATIEIVGSDQKGNAPFTAKLEKDKTYQVKATAPGFLPTTMDVKGGGGKQTVKLDPKPKKVSVASTPDGGTIWIDNKPTGQVTPATVDIPKEKLTARSIKIRIVKAGHKPVEKTLNAAAWTEADDVLTATVEASLEKAAAPVVRPPQGSGSGAGSGAPAGGSGDTGGGNTGGGGEGSNSAPPPPPPPPPDEPEPSL